MKSSSFQVREIITLLLWIWMIFGFSSVPDLTTGLPEDFLLRKVSHAMEFGVLAFLFWRVLQRHAAVSRHAVLAAVMLTVLSAASDELHQEFVPGRDGTLRDILVDAVGGVVGIPILQWVMQKYPVLGADSR